MLLEILITIYVEVMMIGVAILMRYVGVKTKRYMILVLQDGEFLMVVKMDYGLRQIWYMLKV